jgi:SAM-dependent methyltransferase
MIEPDGKNADVDIDVDALMAQIRADIGARLEPAMASSVLGRPASPSRHSHGDKPLRGELTRFRVSDGIIARRSAYDLNEFLAYHDEDFVVSAYRGLLGRAPDGAGASPYLERLRTGDLSKVEILGRIRFSKEGRAAAVTVHGLKTAFALRMIRRVPIAGHLVGIIQYVLRLPRMVRNHERLEAVVFFHQRQMREAMNAVEGEIETQLWNADTYVERVERISEELRTGFATLTQTKADSTALGGAIEDWKSQMAESTSTTAKLADDLTALDQRLLVHRQSLMERDQRMDALERDAASPQFAEEFYVNFEDHFRGTQEDIRQRTEIYLPYVQVACDATGDTSILDIGCGRGEWLKLLTEREYCAKGVDLNGAMVEHCIANSLDVVKADAIDFLRELESNSLSVVTAVHVIEHLPFQRVMVLFDEVRRVLRPGGVGIFETPNPENLIVGACNFWYDPTHRRPLPPEPMRFVLGQCGYSRVEILRLHPRSDTPNVPDPDALATAVIDRLYGAQDYALIGYIESRGQ